MREDGSLGQCQCGRERFHSRFCTNTIGSGRKISPERKQAVIAAIMRGETFHQISSDMKFADKSAARSYLKFLTPEQRSRRKAMEAARRRETSYATSFRPYQDGVYAQIAQAVPRWLSDATRDDAISDIYLAILEGDLQRQDIGRVASRFARRAASQWESKFGPKSLDEAAYEGGRETIGDLIPDADSLEPLEHRLSACLHVL